MNPSDTDLNWLQTALPSQFDFYHLGKIRLESPPLDLSSTEFPFEFANDTRILGFGIYGDFKALVLISLHEEMEFETYSEAGNILASQIVQKLNLSQDWDLMITPPLSLTAKRLKDFMKLSPWLIRRTYLHEHQEKGALPMEVLILPWLSRMSEIPELSKGIGYA